MNSLFFNNQFIIAHVDRLQKVTFDQKINVHVTISFKMTQPYSRAKIKI